MPLRIGEYRKTIMATVGTLITWGVASWVPDGHISRIELGALAVALGTVYGVFGIGNDPKPVVAQEVGPLG